MACCLLTSSQILAHVRPYSYALEKSDLDGVACSLVFVPVRTGWRHGWRHVRCAAAALRLSLCSPTGRAAHGTRDRAYSRLTPR
jgi:hypothetical protein